MANLDWSQCPDVESIPGKVSGAWVFKDTRMPVATVFQNLEAGLTVEEFAVTREQISAILHFAAKSLQRPPIPAHASSPADASSFDHGPPRSIAQWLHSISCYRLTRTSSINKPRRPPDCRRGSW